MAPQVYPERHDIQHALQRGAAVVDIHLTPVP